MAEQILLDWKFADAVFDGVTFGMRTKSGDGRTWPDDEGATHFMPALVGNRTLGAALRDCLGRTRLLTGSEFRQFFSKAEMKRNKQSFIDAQVANMHAKSFAALRKKLAWVGIMVTNSELHLQPTYNASGREWLFLSDRDVKDIKIPYDSDDALIGAALREAFKRCEGAGRADLTFEEPLPD